MTLLATVHETAARLGYVDARAASLPEGLDLRVLRRHLHRIGWEAWHPGFWVPGGGDPPYLVRCRIVLAAAGRGAMLTGASALWALGVLRGDPDDVEVLLPADRWRRPREHVRVTYTTDHASVRAVSARGLRCVQAVRALADHARDTDLTTLCRVAADAIRLRRCTLVQLRAEVARRAHFPGRARLREACERLGGQLNHSGDERLARDLLAQARVQVPSSPGPVVHRARVVAEVDLPFYDVCYGVEVDGPPHLLPGQAAKDTARDRMLRRDCGWSIDRFWWFELHENPERFVREVVARLRSLGSTAAPPPTAPASYSPVDPT